MIQANELRIGNWVNYKGNECRFSIYDIVNIQDDEDCASLTQPIPLTEQWLIDFGFEKDKDGWYSICFFTDCVESTEKMTISLNLKSFRCAMFDDDDRDVLNPSYPCYTSKSIKHLHQLQNLYFALTGIELTL
tara:strand:- start:171 stop:569 length:399 start_codon:yes stop_codon:yes gene_type:complete